MIDCIFLGIPKLSKYLVKLFSMSDFYSNNLYQQSGNINGHVVTTALPVSGNTNVFVVDDGPFGDETTVQMPNDFEPAIPDPVESRTARFLRLLRQVGPILNTENNWALYIGLSWYPIIVLTTWWGITPGHLFKWENGDIVQTFTPINIMSFLLIMSFTIICLWIVHDFLGVKMHMYKHLVVCVIVFISQTVGSFQTLFNIGLGTAIWCIAFGMIFRLFVKDSSGFMPLEFYIKISIVLLAVNLRDVLTVGAKALVVGWVETSIVFALVALFGHYVLKMNMDVSATVAGGLSICGSSAVAAIADVVNVESADAKTIIFIMSILTIPLIPLVPIVGNAMHFNNNTIGAWIGGSIDSTGAVVASASLQSPDVFRTAVIVKMIQNVWIGPMVVAISVIKFRSFSPKKLWDNFPKFVLGFLLVGLITTFIPDPLNVSVASNCFIISEWFSSISFVLIGYNIYVPNIPKEIVKNKKVLLLYTIGQSFDLVTTACMSFLMFTLA